MSYDPTGRFARRELFALVGAGALLIRKAVAEDSGLNFAGLDHLGLTVADSQKAAAFYARLFGNSVYKLKTSPRRFLKLGSSYVALAPPGQGAQGYRVDHFCPGIAALKLDNLKHFLESQALTYRETEQGPFVTDPDGIRIQLWMENSWSDSIKDAEPELYPTGNDSIFHPIGLNHILLDVRDPEKSTPFYEKIFGPVTQRGDSRTWFQAGKARIGLLGITDGRRPGVNHFGISAEAFEYDAVMKKVEETGAKPVAPEVAGSPEFLDPDGILVQVMGPRGDRGRGKRS